MANQVLPPLKEWHTFAGGTSAEEGKYGHGITRNGVQWDIQPVSTKFGRHVGYQLWAFGLPGTRGYAWFNAKGEMNFIGGGLHNSPATASKIAREVHEKYFGKKAGKK